MSTAPKSYQDVEESTGMTPAEKAEIDELEAETKGESTVTATETDADAENKANEAAIAAAVQEAPAVVAPVAVAAPVEPVLMAIPAPPKDFAAARDDLKKQYEEGDLSMDDYLDKRDELTRDEATYISQKTFAEQTNQSKVTDAKADAEKAFDDVASAWQTKNADFVANPLRFKAMQEAIAEVDRSTNGTLPVDELFKQAEKIAFEAFNYTPKTVVDPNKAKADLLKERQPNAADVPVTLANTPSAGVDTGTSSFGDLDSADIQTMERAVANMRPAELEKFLLEVDQ